MKLRYSVERGSNGSSEPRSLREDGKEIAWFGNVGSGENDGIAQAKRICAALNELEIHRENESVKVAVELVRG